MADRFNEQLVDGLNMLILLLPGTGISYQGEEIGMTDTRIRWDQTTDVQGLNVGPSLYTTVSRDPERTPFQWNSTLHAGLYFRVLVVDLHFTGRRVLLENVDAISLSSEKGDDIGCPGLAFVCTVHV